MVKHIILWTLHEKYTQEEKDTIKKEIKEGLESLLTKIEGIVEIKVNCDGLPSANVDLMLDSTFSNEEALKLYANHPEHIKVANEKVRPHTASRACFDFII